MNSNRSITPAASTLCVILGLIAAAAVALRCFVANESSLWLDELHTSWSVNDSLADVAGRAAQGNQQPLYFWMVKLCVILFGHSEFSLRLVSIVSGLGTILVAAVVTWNWTRSLIAASVVSTLIAMDSQFIYYATEARPYALMQWLSAIQVGLFSAALWNHKDESKFRRPFWLLGIVSILLVNTHLTSVWLLVAEAIFFIGFCIVDRIRSGESSTQTKLQSFRWLGTVAVVAVGSIPAVFQMVNLAERKGNWKGLSSNSQLMYDAAPAILAWIALPLAFVVAVRMIQNPESKPVGLNLRLSAWPKLTFVAIWALAPLTIVTSLHSLDIAPLSMLRYTLVGSVGFPVFAGVCIGILSSKWARTGLGVLLIAVTIYQNPFLQTLAFEKRVVEFRSEDWRRPLEQIQTNQDKLTQPLFLFSNLIEDKEAYKDYAPEFQAYLRFPIRGLYPVQLPADSSEFMRHEIAGPTLARSHFADQDIRLIIEEGGAWLIVRADADLVNEIRDELNLLLIKALQTKAAKTEVGQIEISARHIQGSPVFLLSVDL